MTRCYRPSTRRVLPGSGNLLDILYTTQWVVG